MPFPFYPGITVKKYFIVKVIPRRSFDNGKIIIKINNMK
jgi:hypothetical protein